MRGMMARLHLGLIFLLLIPSVLAQDVEDEGGAEEETTREYEIVSQIQPSSGYICEPYRGSYAIYDGEPVQVNTAYRIKTIWHNYGDDSIVDVQLNVYENGILIGHTYLHCDADGMGNNAEYFEPWTPEETGIYTIRMELDLYPQSNMTFTFVAVEEKDYIHPRGMSEFENSDVEEPGDLSRTIEENPSYVTVIVMIASIIGFITALLLAIWKRRGRSEDEQ